MTLSKRIARLEEQAARGTLRGRDLEVIRRQVARAEAKLLRLLQARFQRPDGPRQE